MKSIILKFIFISVLLATADSESLEDQLDACRTEYIKSRSSYQEFTDGVPEHIIEQLGPLPAFVQKSKFDPKNHITILFKGFYCKWVKEKLEEQEEQERKEREERNAKWREEEKARCRENPPTKTVRLNANFITMNCDTLRFPAFHGYQPFNN